MNQMNKDELKVSVKLRKAQSKLQIGQLLEIHATIKVLTGKLSPAHESTHAKDEVTGLRYENNELVGRENRHAHAG